jgi:hypothetical protein
VNTVVYIVGATVVQHPTSIGEESCIAQAWACQGTNSAGD